MRMLIGRSAPRVSVFSIVAAVVVASSGCASSGAGAASTTGQSAPRRNPDVVMADELNDVPEGDLLSALKRLRPAFFTTRGPSSFGVGTAPEAIQVYVDGIKAVDMNVLAQMKPQEVAKVEHLSASNATQRYGTGHSLGAIVVTRK